MSSPAPISARPRVTYLLSDLGGGTGHHLLALLESPAATWDARIISEVENTARSVPAVDVEVLPSPDSFSRFPVVQIRRWLTLRRRLRAAGPDILHTYFFWSIVYGRLLKADGRVGHLVENREDLGFKWTRTEYAFLRLTRGIPDRVVCVCDAVRNVVLQREGVAPDRVTVIRNGIAPPAACVTRDRDPRVREEFGIPATAPIVGMVANFQRPVKGAVYFVDALGIVAEAIPDVRFLLIGMGRNQDELKNRAEAAGVGSQLILTGFREDVDRFYDAMDVAGLTSLSEGLSITLLEAMRHGVPVIATDVGGNPEIVHDGETGYLVPPRDPAAFAGRVIELLRNPERRAAFGDRARAVIAADFALSDVAEAYRTVYQNVLG